MHRHLLVTLGPRHDRTKRRRRVAFATNAPRCGANLLLWGANAQLRSTAARATTSLRSPSAALAGVRAEDPSALVRPVRSLQARVRTAKRPIRRIRMGAVRVGTSLPADRA